MKYPRTLPGELSYHHPSHCPADHPGGLNPDSSHQFHAPWCISYVTLGNSRELSGWHLLLSSCIRNPLFLRLSFLALLYFGPYYCLPLFPTAFSGLTIYWLSFIDQFSPERKKKKEPTGKIPQSHLHFISSGYTILHSPYLHPLPSDIPFSIPSTFITMASSTQSLLNLDPEHISCIGGRTVVTCKGCAGNAPRYTPAPR